jgi:hypothetical protein
MTEIFISYAHEQKNQAERLAEDLEADGYTVWWDHVMRAGVDFDRYIRERIEAANVFIVIWSEEAAASPYVRGEARLALRSEKLIPVKVVGFDVQNLPLDFQAYHTVELNDRSAILSAIAAKTAQSSKTSRPSEPFWRRLLRFLRTWLRIILAVVIVLIIAVSSDQGTNLMWWKPCTDKWLSQANYDACFQEAKSHSMPTVVEGRRSWFGLGSDVYRATWVPSSPSDCWDSRSTLTEVEFLHRNNEYTSAGYKLVSRRSFVSADGIELYQATWHSQLKAGQNACYYLPF